MYSPSIAYVTAIRTPLPLHPCTPVPFRGVGFFLMPVLLVASVMRWKARRADGNAAPHPAAAPAVPLAVAALFVNPHFDPHATKPTIYDRIIADKAEIYDSLLEDPLARLSDVPDCTLEEAVAQAQVHCGGYLQGAVKVALQFAATLAAENNLGPLSVAEAAAVHVYTQETPMYHGPPQSATGATIVHRGVHMP